MEKIVVNLKDRSYPIFLDTNLLFNFNLIIKDFYKDKNIYILTDERVSNLYLDKLVKELKDFNCFYLVIEGYEKAKSLDVYESVVKDLLNLGIKRSDLLIAFGGGVIGDLGGFIASSLFRGIDLIMIPTTVLADVDSSVGGKVAINLENHKNILGAFYQPKAVLINSSFLDSLPSREYNNGIGEIIKYGAIKNKMILEELKKEKKVNDWIIKECLKIKKDIVVNDEFDKGERMLLNFGHTFGHVIELNSDLLHGEAVSIGMLIISKIGIKMGITKEYVYDYLKEILEIFNLPTDIEKYKNGNINFLDIIYDKKILSNEINLILLEDIGKSIIKKIDVKDLEEVIKWM